MRVVILINPKLPVESIKRGQEYAEASIGFDLPMKDVEDNVTLAQGLRNIAAALEARSTLDTELI